MASTYLQRTLGTPTLGTKCTFSLWVKRSALGGTKALMGFYTNDSNRGNFVFEVDKLEVRMFDTSMQLTTNSLFRDVSAWYHIVLEVDTTQGTASDRVKFYVNGVQETSFATSSYPSQNSTFGFNKSGIVLKIGQKGEQNDYFDGSMAHVNFIDGTAYDADTFGETDATTGIWKPKTAPSVTYGTNGFFLKFENSGAFGTDSSGNANNFTVNGTMTQNIDTPSNNFATINILTPVDTTVSNGNLKYSDTNSNYKGVVGTLGASSGKYYSEVKVVTVGDAHQVGIVDVDQQQGAVAEFPGSVSNGYSLSNERDVFNNNGVLSGYTDWTGTYTSGDIIGVAMDLDNNKLYFSKNGQWSAGNGTWGSTTFNSSTGDIPINSGVTYTFSASAYNGTGEFNFGNGYFGTTAVSSAQNPDDGIGIFEYDVPTGYYALNTKSINAQEYD